MVTKQNGSSDNIKNSGNKYVVKADGRIIDAVIAVTIPKDPYAKIMTMQDGTEYIQFGSIAGTVEGKQVFFNTFIHGHAKANLRRMLGKEVVGYPVVMEKELPDGRTYLHLDVYLLAKNAYPTHKVLVRINSKDPTEAWWQSKANKPAPSAKDIVVSMPAPIPGFVALVGP